MSVVLDSKSDFSIHIEHNIKKCNKIIGLLRTLAVGLPEKSRPHLDYGDILYDITDNQNFESKTEKVQYKACIAITGAIQGKSRKKGYSRKKYCH